MLFFNFLCPLKKTDVIEIKTGNKIQIESANATATLDMNTISKRQKKNKPFSNTDDVHRLPFRKTGSAKRFSIVAMNLHREHFYTLAIA